MGIRATVVCDAAIGPGRVRCTADATVPGAEIRWADVEIVETPAFITPLKGRLPPSDAVRRSSDAWQFGFAVVARERGQGDLIIRVRVVACQGETCVPLLGSATAKVKVGD
jgi:hypothetical protein